MEPKTAGALTDAEILRFREGLKARQVVLAEQTRLRWAKAGQIAGRAAGVLKSRFSAERVVAFGSLVDPELFHGRSDIDLAAWGIQGGDYYRAVGVLQAIDPDFSVDLILFDDAPVELQRIILSSGVEL
jgi:predicted nucleotidyltransferase